MAYRPLAVVTGASTGIGFELARCAAEDGYDLVIAAEEAAIETAATSLRESGVDVMVVIADLGTETGIDRLWKSIEDRDVDYLMANAGRGLGHAFVDQDLAAIEDVIHVNVTGTTSLLHRMVPKMRARGRGRILVTGSIAGSIPGSYQAVYNATKAYLDTLAWAIRDELKDSGVTVTCLMPGPTETAFFERAGMMDTPVGRDEDKDDPTMVARKGYHAMLKGKSGVTTGFMNKVQNAFAGVIPDRILARMHRDMAESEKKPND